MTSIVIYFIAFVQAIFATYTLITMKRKASASSLLTFFLILIIVDLGIGLIKITYNGTFSSFFPLDACTLAFGPILLLYLRSALLKTPTFSSTNLLHFLPFLFFLSLSMVLKGDQYSFRIQYFKSSEINNIILIIYSSLSYISILVYSILCWSNIGKAKRNIEDYYSFDKAEKMIDWFRYLTFVLFITYTVPALIGVMSVISGIDTFDTGIIIVIGLGLICFSVTYFLINSHEIFVGDEKSNTFEINSLSKPTSYSKSSLPKETLDKCADKLVDLMENKKIYLRSELSLDDVASISNFPKHYITQALNIVLRKNFYLFVNEYRVKEFKNRVTDKKNNCLTLSAIAMDSGFNSKSTFNNIFKKFTGQTPTEFAEVARNKQEKSEDK